MAQLDRLLAEVEREAARVGVDWDAAAPRLRAIAPQQERIADDGESIELAIGLDVTGLLRTLRSLPSGAGTAAFLAAMTESGGSDHPPDLPIRG
jgi:hypothetical protein